MGMQELRQADKRHLYELLMLQKLNTTEVKGLKETISRLTATMEQDDVKVVKQEINEFFDKPY